MLAAFLPKSVSAVLEVPISELSDEQMTAILADFGLSGFHPDLRNAAVQLLQDRGIHRAADAVQHPEAIKQLRGLLKNLKLDAAPARVCVLCDGSLEKVEGLWFCTSCGIQQ